MAAILIFLIRLEQQLYIGPDIIMGCYPCTIKRETNFYQPKQGYPHNCRTTLILQTKIQKKQLCPEISQDPRSAGHFFTSRYLVTHAKRVNKYNNYLLI